MPSRRHHAKTTTGCFSCKARRVKCDESQPKCKSCVRRSADCQYPFDSSAALRSSYPENVGTRHDAFSSGSSPQLFDALDLTLMHRYCTNTSVHLLPSPEAQHVWQMVVPAKAATHPILHSAILALAAMDLAASHAVNPDDAALTAKYRARGLHHQQVALPMFQEMLTRRDPAQNNIIFLFSIMLILLAFASLQSTGDPPTIEDILQVFALFRGPRALWDIRDTADSELTEVIFSGEKLEITSMTPPNPEDDGPFRALDAADLDEVCSEAAELLKTTWATVQSLPNDLRAMSYFPAMAKDAFFAKVAEHDASALLVLRHYSFVLEAHAKARWWVGRWPSILEAAIDAA
ncbi:Putative zn(2)-C6 fungal-type DNA-binding domain-containing protein [Septoria linicola]|uniref:Zn(2)-C6 fungal-type DNA-binding domain-containing protein n=1 Tax=Septoria linicola TaxID=215465 RepID=A0A9Q9ANA5_9PEZI|nr:putative zn(2)-C6 fungal-type DNA-binding domain-containing protein [Septoria linicola]USW49137.1 Putative zn(2)-C6 fungal-type DNA-binding domain-containing protein [Septoria linicola]